MTYLFSIMKPSDVATCSCVSQEWCRVASDNRLWTFFLERDFPSSGKTENAKQIYRLHTRLANGVYATRILPVQQRSNEGIAYADSLVLTREEQLIAGFSDGYDQDFGFKDRKVPKDTSCTFRRCKFSCSH